MVSGSCRMYCKSERRGPWSLNSQENLNWRRRLWGASSWREVVEAEMTRTFVNREVAGDMAITLSLSPR